MAEAAIFVTGSRHRSRSQEQLEAIQTRTEGWITGLQLAVLSMRDTEDISTFIDSLKGTQKYTVDYLVEEVLKHQPKFLQLFLLRTSILEQMCGSLDGVTTPWKA